MYIILYNSIHCLLFVYLMIMMIMMIMMMMTKKKMKMKIFSHHSPKGSQGDL